MYYTLHQRLRKIELDFTPASNLSHMNLVQPDASQAESIQPNTPSSDSASDNPTCIKTVLVASPMGTAKNSPVLSILCRSGKYDHSQLQSRDLSPLHLREHMYSRPQTTVGNTALFYILYKQILHCVCIGRFRA